MHIFKQVKESEDHRTAQNRLLLEVMRRAQQAGGNALGLLDVDGAGQLTPRQALHELPEHPESDGILPALQTLHSTQNTLDLAHDTADLRGLMREALGQSSDVEMLRVLQ